MDLKRISTAELVQELSNREGVGKITVKPYQPHQIIVGERKISDFSPIVLWGAWG